MKAVGLNPSAEELAKMVSAEQSEVGFKDFVGLAIRVTNKSKIEEIRAYFREFDYNDDGTISVAEARKFFEKEGLPKEEIEVYVTRMFGSMDTNRDGKISVEGKVVACIKRFRLPIISVLLPRVPNGSSLCTSMIPWMRTFLL